MRRKSSGRKEPPLDEQAARERSLRLLSIRARSTEELRQRLMRDGFAAEVVTDVLAGLTDAGLLDDEEFARSWIAGRAASGIGRNRLAAELTRKGIARDVTESLMAEQIDAEAERRQAEVIARRRLGSERDAKALARVRRLLLTRGYGFATVDDALRAIAGEQEGIGDS